MTVGEFVNGICRALKIRRPTVQRYDGTGTGLADLSSDGKTLRVRQAADERDLYFAIAHELRHGWQLRHRQELLDGYKTRAECGSVEEYNLQPAEIDAHAYAALVMISAFGVRPLFDGLSDDVKKEIAAKMQAIASDE